MTDDIEKLKQENSQLKAVYSIIVSALQADCRYNSQLLQRLIDMRETNFGGFVEALNWRRDSRFRVLDLYGDHNAALVITPNGETFEFNHYNDKTTDLARAHWVVNTLNEAWDKIRPEIAPEVCGCPRNGCKCCPD